jgi:hypothetical protein
MGIRITNENFEQRLVSERTMTICLDCHVRLLALLAMTNVTKSLTKTKLSTSLLSLTRAEYYLSPFSI